MIFLNSKVANVGTQVECQISLNMYPESRGPRFSEKLVTEKILSHVKKFTRKYDRMTRKSNLRNANQVQTKDQVKEPDGAKLETVLKKHLPIH